MSGTVELTGRVVAVLNTASGGCDPACAPRMREILDAAGLAEAEVIAVEGEAVVEALADAVGRADVLIVLGGDGTIGSAANHCTAAGPKLIPLPGGTMNMLPRALYGDRAWDDALAATLAHPAEHRVSAGMLGDAQGRPQRFYCAAILGGPTLWAEARESIREGRIVAAAGQAVAAAKASLAEPVDYRFGEMAGSCEAVVVICPLVSDDCDPDDPLLEAVAFAVGSAVDLLDLAVHAVFDQWRNDASLVRAKLASVSVSGARAIPALLDGERVELGENATICFVPDAFCALVPGG